MRRQNKHRLVKGAKIRGGLVSLWRNAGMAINVKMGILKTK